MAALVLNTPSILPGVRLADVGTVAGTISGGGGYSSQDAVTASTTQTQAGGTKIIAAFTNISSANSSDAITLPQSAPGMVVTFVNSSGQTINVFPFKGDTINAASKDAAVSAATATTSDYYCTKAGQWWGGATTNET